MAKTSGNSNNLRSGPYKVAGQTSDGVTILAAKTKPTHFTPKQMRSTIVQARGDKSAFSPSKELGAIVGPSPLPRPEMVSKVWDYIKKNNLQNPQNKREILADDKLQKIFGKKKVTIFNLDQQISQHLKK